MFHLKPVLAFSLHKYLILGQICDKCTGILFSPEMRCYLSLFLMLVKKETACLHVKKLKIQQNVHCFSVSGRILFSHINPELSRED